MTESANEYRARQAAEYGTYVANQPIYYNGVRAYRKGDAVPVSNVEAHGYVDAGYVDEVKTVAPVDEVTQPEVIDLAKTPGKPAGSNTPDKPKG